MQHGQTSTHLLREDFKEHNFIFTQWKKMMHFNVMKSIKVRLAENPADQNSQNEPAAAAVPETNLSN